MTTFLLIVTGGLVTGTWLLARVRTLEPPGPFGLLPTSVSIVIPARDEAENLPTLLASLARLDPAPSEILVIDDGSDDDTAGLARRSGATVIPAGQIPPGWFGKPWACHVGATAATGTILVFLDADTELASDALGRLLATHAVKPDGLLSVQPFHQTERPYEQLSAYCNVVSMLASGAFTPRGSGESQVAFGPCLVSSVDAYRAVGGHESVRHEVLEDVALARRYRASGLAVRCFGGGDAVQFRMYPEGLRQLIEGWTKNLAGGPAVAPLWATIGASLWVSAGAATAARALRLAMPGATLADLALVTTCWLALAVQLRWMLRRIGAFHWWAAAVFPVPLAAFFVWFLRSALHRRLHRSVRWRGRELSVRPRPAR